MELSDHARELLNDLSSCDPWAMMEIPDIIVKYESMARHVSENGDRGKTPEDVVNEIGGILSAWLIIMQDHLPTDIDEILESLKWQYEALTEYRPKHRWAGKHVWLDITGTGWFFRRCLICRMQWSGEGPEPPTCEPHDHKIVTTFSAGCIDKTRCMICQRTELNPRHMKETA